MTASLSRCWPGANHFASFSGMAEMPQFLGSCSLGRDRVTLAVVKLTVKCDYAARAVLGLARHYSAGRAIRVESLAKEQSIPQNYLVQILIELKSTDIVRSQRGKDGGYLLARDPSKISIGDVLRCIHGEVFDPPKGDSACPEELRVRWLEIQAAVDEAAQGITFSQILDSSNQDQEMYYI
ncbi:Rrf2 family transcriptional regulator [Verrucomicrobia bacterium]|nr:Rrf2 family transcriptional regulator [Verrucomicrobiota bacterium]